MKYEFKDLMELYRSTRKEGVILENKGYTLNYEFGWCDKLVIKAPYGTIMGVWAPDQNPSMFLYQLNNWF